MDTTTIQESAAAILARAREREERVAAATPRIDYERMKWVRPKQKAALTRACKSGTDPRTGPT